MSSDTGLSPEQVRQLRELAETGFLPTIEGNAKALTAPFFWYDPSAPIGSRTQSGGTIFFVHTGTTLLGISAAHVHREVTLARQRTPDLACQIGAHSFDPEARLIDIDDDLDLVTYRLTAIQVAAARGDIHHAPVWPPRSIAETDLALAGGWPWRMTAEAASDSTHQFLHFIGKLSAASDTNLGLPIFKSSSVPWGDRALTPGENLGGMSGGPLFALRLEPLVRLDIVGVIYQYHQIAELMLCRPLSRVGPEGTLVR